MRLALPVRHLDRRHLVQHFRTDFAFDAVELAAPPDAPLATRERLTRRPDLPSGFPVCELGEGLAVLSGGFDDDRGGDRGEGTPALPDPRMSPAAAVVGTWHARLDGDVVEVLAAEGHLTLAFARPLAAGWYRVTARIEANRPIRPRLVEPDVAYRWGGGGGLFRQVGHDSYALHIRFGRSLSRVHFAPASFPARLRLEQLVFEKLSAREVLAVVVPLAARLLARDGSRGRGYLAHVLRAAVRRRASTISWSCPQPMTSASRSRLYAATRRDDAVQACAPAGPDVIARGVTFLVLVDTAGEDDRAITDTLASLRDQTHAGWHVALAGSAARRSGSAAGPDAIPPLRFDGRRPLSAWVADRAAEAGAVAVVVVEAGDRLAPEALAVLAPVFAAGDGTDLVVRADADRLDARRLHRQPERFGAFDPDLALAAGAVGGLPAIGRNVLPVGDSPAATSAGAVVLDAALRQFARRGRAGFRSVGRILVHCAPERPGEARRERERLTVVQAHLDRTGAAARAVPLPGGREFRVRYRLPSPAPLASMIVCVRDQAALLASFLDSLRRETGYRPYELILLDNESREPAALDLLASAAKSPDTILVRVAGPFNFAAMNNIGAARARGEVLVFLNCDMVFVDRDWLGELVSQALRPDVGCVGARLLYPDRSVQHAGIALAGDSLAVHLERGLAGDDPGYLRRQRRVQELSAVTGAALAVRAGLYRSIGGMDAFRFPVAFNDIDLALRLQRLGKRTIWTPFAQILHKESAFRGADIAPAQRERYLQEAIAFDLAWNAELRCDPFYPAAMDVQEGRFLPASTSIKASRPKA